MHRKAALIWFLLAAGLSLPAAAEESYAGTLSFTLENDLFYDVDRHYTNGVRLIWVPEQQGAAPDWALKLSRLTPWFPAEGEIHHGYAVGQSMFTPGDITLENPPPGERPYAGWLYGTIGLGVESAGQLDQFWMTVGVVGPAAMAEHSQKFFHKAIATNKPRGWETQLHNEPGLVATYQRSWRGLAASTLSGTQWDVTPHVGGALGNVYTYANAGLTVRYGPSLPDDYGPPRIQPGLPGSGDFSRATELGWYLFAGIEARAVARNIFLDGNSFRDSRSVDKKPLVGDLQFGLVLDWQDIRLSYTHVIRTREFTGQDSQDEFGSLTLSLKI